MSNDEKDCDRPDAYVNFVERVNASGDDPGLTLSWSPTFGISVIYPEDIREEEAVSFLNRFVA